MESLQYGVDFDFSKPFLEQFYEFAKHILRPNLLTDFEYDENSYTNHAGKTKLSHDF